MKHKKLFIGIIASVLVVAVSLTVCFVCRKDRKLSELSDRELINLLDKSGIFIPNGFDAPMIRKMIVDLEALIGKPEFEHSGVYSSPLTYDLYNDLRSLVKDYYGITPVDSTEAPPSTEPTESAEPSAAPKIAATSSEGMKPAYSWYWDETTQLRYGNVPSDEILFLVDAEAALAGLANGTYDVAILPCASGETPSFGDYAVFHLFDDAIIFVHGNPTSPGASYDLALETIRSIYEDGGEFYWDTAKQEPLVPAFRFDDMSQELSYIFDIESTADEIMFGEEYSMYIWEATRGSALHPLYYSFLSGDAGINGVVISVDSVLPTEATIADRTYPLVVSFYAVFSADDANSASLAAELQTVAQQQP